MEKIFTKKDLAKSLCSKTLLALITVFCVSFSMFAQTSPASRQVARPKGSTSCYYGFYEYLPSNYSSASKLPVVLFFHGIGEAGNGTTDLYKVLRNGPPAMVQGGKDFPFILISPQHNDGWWNNIGIDLMLQYIKKTYKVDTDRIYVTGLSAGGYGTWAAGQGFASQLAGIVPICGCGNSSLASNMKNLSVWAFHNSGDPTVQLSCSTTMVNAIKAAGGNPKLTIYDKNAHDAWTVTYKDQNMWDWLLAQRRYGSTSTPVVNKAPVANAGSDVSITLPTNSVTLKGSGSDSDGSITKYLWTKQSGSTATLTNSTTATLSVSGLVQGTYVFRLTVTDNSGATAYNDATVTVNPAPTVVNSAPVLASIGSKTVTGGNTSTISVSATDADKDAIMFSASGLPAYAVLQDNNNGTGTITMSPSSSSSGSYSITISATDSKGAKDSETFTLTVNSATISEPAPAPAPAPETTATVLYRINAGGDEVTATPINWEKDKLTAPSKYLLASTYNTEGSCWWTKTNTTDGPKCLFGSFRTSSDSRGIRYGFPVQTGDYKVNLYFAQKDNSWWAGPQKAGDHVFDIFVEGKLSIDNLDLFVENGYNAVKKSVTVTVTDGILNLDLKNVKGYPQINGIEIVGLTGGTTQSARFTTEAVETGKVIAYPNPLTENNSITLEFTNPVNGNISITLIDQIGNPHLISKSYIERPTLKHTVDLSSVHLNSGIYFLKIQNENKKATILKIIKK